jgi:hypothetical protein
VVVPPASRYIAGRSGGSGSRSLHLLHDGACDVRDQSRVPSLVRRQIGHQGVTVRAGLTDGAGLVALFHSGAPPREGTSIVAWDASHVHGEDDVRRPSRVAATRRWWRSPTVGLRGVEPLTASCQSASGALLAVLDDRVFRRRRSSAVPPVKLGCARTARHRRPQRALRAEGALEPARKVLPEETWTLCALPHLPNRGRPDHRHGAADRGRCGLQERRRRWRREASSCPAQRAPLTLVS